MSIEARNITKRFGSFTALDNVTLEVGAGTLTALVGPSGSGKTTLLRIIAGLELPDSGSIYFHGEDATDRHVRERQVGFVFQHYALFRHMTVFENVAFGMKIRPRHSRASKEEIRKKVDELLDLVQLRWLSDRFPSQLSGGQRQRIALARALAIEPKVLLLDEPFGALDAKVRKELRRWLRRLHDEVHITSVFVTHDQDEAMEVADTVVIMNEGRIEQMGSPQEVYEKPANPFVYGFLGDVNLFHSHIHKGQANIGGVNLAAPEYAEANNAPAIAFVRPHQLEISRERDGKGGLEAVVRYLRTLGPVVRLELDCRSGGEQVVAELPGEQYQALNLREGDRVFIHLKDPRFYLKDGSNWERAWMK